MRQLDLLEAPQASTPEASPSPERLDHPGQPVQLYRGFLPTELADRLLAESLALDWQQNTITMLGKSIVVPRKEYMMGDSPADMRYSYSGSVNLYARPWEPSIKALRDRISTFTGYGFQVAIGNLYQGGQNSIGYHADDEPSMGIRPAIASISLGETRMFRVKSKQPGTKSVGYELRHGDLLLMEPGCQEEFLHALPKTAKNCGVRVNWTFRPYRLG